MKGFSWISSETKYLWLYSGIFMVLFSMFFIEIYYTAPTNVISNVVALFLILISTHFDFASSGNIFIWRLFLVYLGVLLTVSITSIILKDQSDSPESRTNRISEILKDVSVRFGNGKILYSAAFLYFVIEYFDISTVFPLFIFWWILIVTEPQKLYRKIRGHKNENVAIGEIFGVQSKKIFLVKLYDERPSVKKFDTVVFRYSKGEESDYASKGFVFDTYMLNQEKWAKVVLLQTQVITKNAFSQLKPNVVIKQSFSGSSDILNLVNRFAGIIVEHSNIGVIKFEYSMKSGELQEGDLIELKSQDGKIIFYQVTNAVTSKEVLEAKNETGFIQGEAIQIGIWDEERGLFEKYGWVPQINTLVLRAKTDDLGRPKTKYPDFDLGVIPSTDLPVVINLEDSISHHLAILGVTGSGKSFISHKIIAEIIKSGTKVVCVDFTGEYMRDLSEFNPKSVKNDDVENFLKGKDGIGIFELPELSNTTDVLMSTQDFLSLVFKFAKDNVKAKICIVIEEAHTVIPETNFLGDF
ncbi:MAG: DUF87 domain-containing protein, partial [Candidatus Magasanikbacteria bacterium]|nr:DUF87 domain-containing protein [Candidatus Magasanikbacteria bacterium]